MKIDEIDRRILLELLKDSRLSMRELAKKVNLSAPSVAERVRKLESEGIIEGYTVNINYKKLGLGIECLVEVTLKNGEYERFKRFIERDSRAVFCYRIAGKACYMVKLRLAALHELEEFINEVISYAGTVSHIILSEVKIKNSFLEQL
ncbi:MAG TPA: Lrp/AsnC family transcriptional regulator [Anoxybacillus sp.]|jgi:Lrp/AsnC family transcriptional regulator, leucine-responsive regulatory protein|nr:Lrp/AsnC family transcriptional regulator [Anoxybacillus sp.]